MPTGFAITGTPTVTDSNPPGGTWVISVSGNTITVHASGTSSELQLNTQYVRVTFTATVPATTGTYGSFISTVYEHYDKSGSGPGTLDGNDPIVTVYSAGVLDHFTITGYPTSVTAGQSFGGVIVTAYDGGNNVLTGYTGSIYFTSTDGSATLPYTSAAKYTFTSGTGQDNGVHTFATGFVLKTAGSQTITVTDGSKGATTTAITVNPGSLNSFTITGAPSTTTSGVSFGGIIVTAYDAYGNIATNYRGQVQFTSTDTAATLPGAYTFTGGDSGVHTFSGFTLRTVGSWTITVAQGSTSATTSPITVTTALGHFTITGYPTSVTAGQNFGGIVVTAYDTSNNVLTTYTGSVYFTSNDTNADLPYTSGTRYTFTSGDAGVHTFSGFTLNTAGHGTITVTDGSNSATTTAIAVNSHYLDFRTAGGQTLAAGQVSSSITIRRYNSDGSSSPPARQSPLR